jgi:hypothetical protein
MHEFIISNSITRSLTKTVKKDLKWLSNELNVKSMEDWYNISPESIIALNGGHFMKQCGGMIRMLMKYFPGNIFSNNYSINAN